MFTKVPELKKQVNKCQIIKTIFSLSEKEVTNKQSEAKINPVMLDQSWGHWFKLIWSRQREMDKSTHIQNKQIEQYLQICGYIWVSL